ncbi:MAG: DsbA family oxidoreductase [Burkholderiaceae bacterium]|nr:DsbA family oxidoreductase [Burkholderiaceae bacterium]
MSTNEPGNDAAHDAPAALKIDVISDVVCPWCFVGKRQLEQALARWREAHPEAPAPDITWHPFQLNPDMPDEGISRAEYLASKFGTSDPARIYTNVRRAADQVGLSLNIEAITRQPSTVRPHALLGAAFDAGLQDAMAEALFRAYFIEGRDLADRNTLAALAREAGLDEERIADALDNADTHQRVVHADIRARKLGISGVPFFIVNNRIGVSGAAGADALTGAFERAENEPDTEAQGEPT